MGIFLKFAGGPKFPILFVATFWGEASAVRLIVSIWSDYMDAVGWWIGSPPAVDLQNGGQRLEFTNGCGWRGSYTRNKSYI